MSTDSITSQRPSYDRGARSMLCTRAARAKDFAQQILQTCSPFLTKHPSELDVLDVGCGYGHTAVELARLCASVVAIEPSEELYFYALSLKQTEQLANLEFRNEGIYSHLGPEAYDLVVLDNVFEHLPAQPRALEIISARLRYGGVAFILVPNKLWPIEVHYGLPFLSYLPLRIANLYLRFTGRGTDYTDASYAPTYFSLNRMLRARPELSFRYVLPADLTLATKGRCLHYRLGVSLIKRWPWLWAVSKSFLVVAKKGN